jgi:16S rRNA (uracil1498-N3)-methyltransferase
VTPRFYCPLPLAPGAIIDLPSGAAHHAARVLRLQAGTAVTLFNGDGGEFAARLERVDARGASARIDAWSGVERESPLAVTLIQGLASAERMDYAVQKVVELGVAAIVPVVTQRSVTRLDAPRAEKRVQHWQQVAIAACEQCGRNRVPLIHPLRDFGDWLAGPSPAALRLLLAGDALQSLADLMRPRGAIEILAGPEGGLAPDETGAAWRAGFRPVRLGPRTLRAETAGLAAMAALNALWGDWC